mmetsp:Transcript_36372/g.79361  ORF Transcript_36372/g.79361 Transcript_36372/m.79361 type:complete len:89 (-) Transcript_36372:22-288(-)
MVMARLNPGIMQKKAARAKASTEVGSAEKELVQKKKKARIEASKAHSKECKKGDETFYKTLMKAFETKAAEAAAAAAKKEEKEDDEEA